MIKLLIDAHVFDGKYQGTRTYIQGIYSAMITHKDIEFYFAAQNVSRLKSIFGIAENIHYIRLDATNSIWRLAWEYPRIIKKYKIDYAHFQYICPLIKCCKEIVTIHDLLFLDFPKYFPLSYRIKNRTLFMYSAKRADLLLTVSEYSRKEIKRHFKITEDRIYVTSNCVSMVNDKIGLTDVKAKYGLDKYILTVSRIEPRKNHQMLLKAFLELQLYKLGYKLVIVGAMDLKNKTFSTLYKSMTDEEKESVLIFQASYLDLVAVYKQAALFVFPSFAEGFGIPPIEAVAYSCPTLCSNQTAMAEFDFFHECFFSPYDIRELKNKIMYFIQNDVTQICEALQKEIVARYNWKNVGEKLYQLIKDDKK